MAVHILYWKAESKHMSKPMKMRSYSDVIFESTSTIKELICTCCGGTIDKIKQKCMYCGTQYIIYGRNFTSNSTISVREDKKESIGFYVPVSSYQKIRRKEFFERNLYVKGV